MTPRNAVAIYNIVCQSHGLKQLRSAHKIQGDIKAFIRWCDHNHVDPERWIRARFEAAGGRHRIRFKSLPSDKFLEKFRLWGDDHQAQQVSQERIASRMVRGGQSLTALEPLHEAMRRVWTLGGQPELCAADHAWSGGWHPRSAWCSACGHVGACKAAMPDRLLSARSSIEVG